MVVCYISYFHGHFIALFSRNIYLSFIASVHGFVYETSDFLLYDTFFIYQVLCTLIYRRSNLYSFLLNLIMGKMICLFFMKTLQYK